MAGFIVIIALIITGFSLIFLVFDRKAEYGFYLYEAYNVLYGPVSDDSSFGFSEKLLASGVLFFLNVVLLNLLISIMGDSYDRVLEKRDRTDALTRLEMIQEGVTYMKLFKKKRGSNKKGFLVYCLLIEMHNEEDGEGDEWEGKINLIRRLLKQNEQKVEQIREITEKKITTLEENMREGLNEIKQKVRENQEAQEKRTGTFEENVKSSLDEMRKTLLKSQETNENNHKEIMTKFTRLWENE